MSDQIICTVCDEPADSACTWKSCPYAVPKPKLAEVVQLRDGRPSLNDIPARLRWLADQIENTPEYSDIQSCLIILGNDTTKPQLYQFGSTMNFDNPLALIAMAQHEFITRLRDGENTP